MENGFKDILKCGIGIECKICEHKIMCEGSYAYAIFNLNNALKDLKREIFKEIILIKNIFKGFYSGGA